MKVHDHGPARLELTAPLALALAPAVALAALLAGSPQTAFAQKGPGAPPDVPEAAVKAAYKKHCQLCHLDGASPIAELNFVDGKWKHGSSSDDILKIIRDGAPGTAMMGFKDTLSASEIRALAAYVRAFDKSLKPEKPKSP